MVGMAAKSFSGKEAIVGGRIIRSSNNGGKQRAIYLAKSWPFKKSLIYFLNIWTKFYFYYYNLHSCRNETKKELSAKTLFL